MKTAAALAFAAAAAAASAKPIAIEEQDSFTVGGTYVTHEGTFLQDNFTSEDG